jgi:REP element-mobilizing transposase RayT
MKKYVIPVADVYAYCLLANHFHLLLRIKDKEEIKDSVLQKKPYLGFSHMFNSYTQGYNHLYKRKGSLFQEQLKRLRVTAEDYFIQLVVYIHLNPVKHGFTDSLNYTHSSYRSMLSNSPTLLKRNVVIEYFGDINNFIEWHDFKKIQYEQTLWEP